MVLKGSTKLFAALLYKLLNNSSFSLPVPSCHRSYQQNEHQSDVLHWYRFKWNCNCFRCSLKLIGFLVKVSMNTMQETHHNFLDPPLPTECFATQHAGTVPDAAPSPSGPEHNGLKMEDVLVCMCVFLCPKKGRQGSLLFNLYPGEEMPPLVWLHFTATICLTVEGVKRWHIVLHQGNNWGRSEEGSIDSM